VQDTQHIGVGFPFLSFVRYVTIICETRRRSRSRSGDGLIHWTGRTGRTGRTRWTRWTGRTGWAGWLGNSIPEIVLAVFVAWTV
jgi:hypothetical protein